MAIVEGHGEVIAIRVLLERIWYEHLHGDFIDIVPPWRASQGVMRTRKGLRSIVKGAAKELHDTENADLRRLLLILLDTEGEECPGKRGPERARWAREERSDSETEIAFVMPNPMFETWFAAAALSLRGKNDLPDDLVKPGNPEGAGLGKEWMKEHLPRKYKETVDQAKFVGHMSLTECHDSSRSFRKLCKELELRLPAPS
jgi:hypothetical protein